MDEQLKRLLLLLLLIPNLAFGQNPNPTQQQVLNAIASNLPTNNANQISALLLRNTLDLMTSAIFAPPSFIGTNTNPITQDGAQVTIQNSSTTQEDIFNPLTGGAVYDGTRSTVYIPPGSTVLNAEAFGAYVRNRSGTSNQIGNGVLFYGLATCGVSNTSCWGENYRLSDTEDNLSHSATNIALIGSEIDYGIRNTATIIQGIALLGAGGNVQPAGADGFTCGSLDPTNINPPKWTHCIAVPDNVASTGIYLGTSGPQGANVQSIPIQFGAWDSASIEHFMNLNFIPFGTNSALSILDLTRANGFFFEMTQTGSPPLIGTQGSDTNIGLLLAAKNAGTITLGVPNNQLNAAVNFTLTPPSGTAQFSITGTSGQIANIAFQGNAVSAANGWIIGANAANHFFAEDVGNAGAFIWQMTSGNIFAFTPVVSFASGLTTPTFQASTIYSAAGTPLPTCNSGTDGTSAVVSDATSATYAGTYTSGGAQKRRVLCINGTGWTTQ